MIHTVVQHRPGEFSAWPANGGLWQWGNEILVSYQCGVYKDNPTTHCIDESHPIQAAFARSMDGGQSWATEAMQHAIFDRKIKPVPTGGFDFSNPDFVMRIGRPTVTILSPLYIVSLDRGHTWDGPYALPDFGYPLTARTSYLIEGPKRMRLFLSYKLPSPYQAAYSDRAFVAITDDGGQTYSLVGEMTDDIARSVMPIAARMPDGSLVAVMRRRLTKAKYPPEEIAKTPWPDSQWEDDNWIESRRSLDDGRTWIDPVRAGETAHEYNRNGNPPAMGLLPDGRLVLVFGYRGKTPAIKARVSSDGGRSWGEEIILRQDARNYDLGYPRLAVLPDGTCVAIYYIATNERFEQHIEATVFRV